MDKDSGVAEAESTAGSAGSDESDDLALLQALEAEETAGRSADTTTETTQESAEDSLDGDTPGDGSEADAAEGEAGTEDGTETEEEAKEGEDEEPQGRPEKRIAKLVAQRNEVTKERDELRAEVERLKSGTPQPEGPWDPLGADPEFAAAKEAETKSESEYRAARGLLRQLQRDPEKVLETVAKVFKVEDLTPEKAQDLLEDYMERHEGLKTEAKTKRIAKETEIRQVNEQASRMWEGEADADMPWMKNPDDPRQTHVRAILKTHPWVAKIPAGRWLVAAAASKLRSLELRQQRAQEAAKRKPGTSERRIVPAAGRASPGAGRPPVKGAARMAVAARRHQENPSDENLAGYLESAVS